MITYKPIIIQGGRRKDGTYPVKVRVTFRGVSRRLPTTLVCTDQDITRSGKIKNATILQKAGELITRMRATCDNLSPFTLEGWTVDDVVAHIRTTLTAQTFKLDFIAFGRDFILSKDEGTRSSYTTALNAFSRFLGSDSIDVNEITRAQLVSFQEWADQQGRVFYNYRKGEYQSTGKPTAQGGNAGRWTQRLAHIFQAAKERYNDEDAGRILIPRSPFASIPKPKVVNNGENPLPFLKECGASNPSASWNYIRKAAVLEDPERAGRLRQPLPANKQAEEPKVELVYDPEIAEEYKREQAQKAANAAARAAQFPGIETPEGHILQGIPNAAARVEAEKKCTVPLNYDGFYVTAVRAPYGEFHYDKKHDLLEFKGAGGEEVSYSPMSWKIIIEDVKKIMKILDVEV